MQVLVLILKLKTQLRLKNLISQIKNQIIKKDFIKKKKNKITISHHKLEQEIHHCHKVQPRIEKQ